MKTRLLKLLLSAVQVLLLAACAAEKDTFQRPVSKSSGKNGEPLAILFIGNSYSFHVPRELKRFAARNGKTLRIGQVTNGGWTLQQHARNEATLRAIGEGSWDIVVLQEQSRIPSQPVKRVPAMYPAVLELAETARSHGAEPVLYQTWGYRDGDPKLPGDDFHSMTARVREGYTAAAAEAGGLRVIPAGDAWEREIIAGRGSKLFQDDGSHPTRDANRLTASVFYEALCGTSGEAIRQTPSSASQGSSGSP
jgi:hypothetical protein